MTTLPGFFLMALTIAASASTPDAPAGALKPAPFTVETADGLAISGRLYRRGGDVLLIYCHSLLRSGGHLGPGRALEILGPRFDLLVFDARGHRLSHGTSSAGGDGVLDVRAVLGFAHARGYERIALVGAGMGATVAARAALIFGNVDALVAVSPSGFSSDVMPPVARALSSLMLDTAYGEMTLRLVANTRLRPRDAAGYAVDLAATVEAPPMLVIHAEDDRQVRLDVLERLLEKRFPRATLRLVPGRGHAEELLDDAMIAEIRDFLDATIPPTPQSAASLGPPPAIVGDRPIPTEVARSELEARPVAGPSDALARRLEKILAFRGYVLASVSGPDSAGALVVATPRIRRVTLTGNRRVSDEYLRSVLGLGGGYFNAWELDAATRRLSADPAIASVAGSVVDYPDGDVGVAVKVTEKSPLRLFVSARFTDIDDFYGVGATWNEVNPTGLQLSERVLYGREGGRILNETGVGKTIFGDALTLSATQYNMIRSRDELEFVFLRQEVHNVGGQAAARYRASDNVAVQLGGFGQRDRLPEGDPELPVTEGTAAGGVAMLELGGRMPLQGPAWLRWFQTAYYKRTGMFGAGDFSFHTVQWNLAVDAPVARHVSARATGHAGRVSGGAPPQELLSLGGMHTLPGYDDDRFVGGRLALTSVALYISARTVVQETSRWAPLRLIVSGHAGTVWSPAAFDADRVASDVMVEVDYRKLARIGYVVPVGGMRGEADPRFFVGWGEHVQW